MPHPPTSNSDKTNTDQILSLQEITEELKTISQRLQTLTVAVDRFRAHHSTSQTQPTQQEQTNTYCDIAQPPTPPDLSPSKHRARDYDPGGWNIGDLVVITNT